jgi:hypothetical protein
MTATPTAVPTEEVAPVVEAEATEEITTVIEDAAVTTEEAEIPTLVPTEEASPVLEETSPDETGTVSEEAALREEAETATEDAVETPVVEEDSTPDPNTATELPLATIIPTLEVPVLTDEFGNPLTDPTGGATGEQTPEVGFRLTIRLM